MVRNLFWLAGCAGLFYLMSRFAVWHIMAQIVLVFVLFLWVIVGGWLCSRGMRVRAAQPRATSQTERDLRASVARAEKTTADTRRWHNGMSDEFRERLTAQDIVDRSRK